MAFGVTAELEKPCNRDKGDTGDYGNNPDVLEMYFYLPTS
jgi:hypothetical protein